MFSWDVAKALKNYEKHGVSFEDATTVFDDPLSWEWEDIEHSEREQRLKRLGVSAQGWMLVLVYTKRSLENGTQTIRLITARRASRKERQIYSR
jgi:hypothetical protein